MRLEFLTLSLIAALAITPVEAATFTVDADSGGPDDNPGDGICATNTAQCTLRAAIQEANALAGADLIEIPPLAEGTYFAIDYTITQDVRLRGLGPDRVPITGVAGDRLFTVDPPGFQMEEIVFENLHLFDGFPSGTGTQRGGLVMAKARSGQVVFKNCRLAEGVADEGGAIFKKNFGSILKIIDSEVWSNFANVAGGAIYVNGASMEIHRSDFASNESALEGGAIYLRNFTSAVVEAVDSTFRNNIADVSGGAVVLEEEDAFPRITLRRTRFVGNVAGDGGALDLRGGRATIVDCEFEGNQAVNLGSGGTESGGAIRIIGNGGSGSLVPVVTIEGTTMSSNLANTGGAILVGNGVLSMANSTLSGNDADVSGGGIFAGFFGLVQLASVTVTDNEAAPGDITMGDGGGLFISGGLVKIRDSFVAGNEARRSGTGGSVKEDADCDGTLTSEGYNLIGITEGCTVVGDTTGNITNFLIEAADLGPLLDNGGPTQTHEIGASSNALDAGNPAGCAWDHDADSGSALKMLRSDQRGFLYSDPRCDGGAFERGGLAPQPIFSDGFESGDTTVWSAG